MFDRAIEVVLDKGKLNMLAPHIKKNVDKLWNLFWTAGITNPLVAVEQITYLLFLKRLEGIDNHRTAKGLPSLYRGKKRVDNQEVEFNYDTCRWTYIEQDKTPQHLINVVFPWLRDLEKHFTAIQTATPHHLAPGSRIDAISNRMSDAYFQLDPNKGAILQQAIDLINHLFDRVDLHSATTDIMGDTFEYLLSEIASAGKNGQFRTPRHIIRCMVELLDPGPGAKIIDPAAGTGGFLFSSLSYILARHTSPELLRLEWDGTPHRAYGNQLGDNDDTVHQGHYYVGFDSDRTMVRIGWMNMILHGIENPHIYQRDSLGKRRDDDPLQTLLAAEQYQYVLANPPFTGTVDTDDLDNNSFPKIGTRGKKATQVVTNKSELLFVWRMLDLLAVGGRCAVIVPEGVLFGHTEGHIRLRRELLTEHTVEAVISLPVGVFHPYTGAKTSILVFQKETPNAQRHYWKAVDSPRTQQVWFYEVEEEAFTRDTKRNERRNQNNDLWDMLEKFHHRHEPNYTEFDYFQPNYWEERWRMVDNHTVKVFQTEPTVAAWNDKVAAIHELFTLPANPEEAYKQIHTTQQPRLEAVAKDIFSTIVMNELTTAPISQPIEPRETFVNKILSKASSSFRNQCERHKHIFDPEEKVAYRLYQKSYKAATDIVCEVFRAQLTSGQPIKADSFNESHVVEELVGIAQQYARLDGYTVTLASLERLKRDAVLKNAKHWVAPVRVYLEESEWHNQDGTVEGSHDNDDRPRSDYLAATQLYDDKGQLNDSLLDPDCIEARGWNLSASQYKPLHVPSTASSKSVADSIREIMQKKSEILHGLERLLTLVEDNG